MELPNLERWTRVMYCIEMYNIHGYGVKNNVSVGITFLVSNALSRVRLMFSLVNQSSYASN